MPYLLYFFVLLLPLRNIVEKIPKLSEGLGFINIMVVVLILAWVFKGRAKEEGLLEKTPLNLPIFLFMVITYIGLWKGSFYLGEGIPLWGTRFTEWKDFIILPLLYFIVVNNIKTKREIKILILLMIVVMIYMDSYFYREIRWYSLDIYRDKLRMFSGTFGSVGGSNEWAAFFAQYSMVVLALFLFDEVKSRKYFFLFIFVMNILVLTFTYSRGGYLAALAGLAFIGLVKERKILVLLAILLIFYSTIVPTSVIQRIEMTTTQEGELDSSSKELDSSSKARLEYWEFAWETFQNNPVLGTGFHTIIRIGPFRDTHNMYMNILAELGIIGFALFIYLFWLAAKHGWQLYRSAGDPFLKGLGLGFTACVIASMVANIFGNRFSYLCLGGYYWVFLGLVMRAKMLEEKEPCRKNSSKIGLSPYNLWAQRFKGSE